MHNYPKLKSIGSSERTPSIYIKGNIACYDLKTGDFIFLMHDAWIPDCYIYDEITFYNNNLKVINEGTPLGYIDLEIMIFLNAIAQRTGYPELYDIENIQSDLRKKNLQEIR